MTDQPTRKPKLSVAFHFLGQPKPSFIHGDRIDIGEHFVSVGTTTPGEVDTRVHINKDIIERFVQMPYDPELNKPEETEEATDDTTGLELDLGPATVPEEARPGSDVPASGHNIPMPPPIEDVVDTPPQAD